MSYLILHIKLIFTKINSCAEFNVFMEIKLVFRFQVDKQIVCFSSTVSVVVNFNMIKNIFYLSSDIKRKIYRKKLSFLPAYYDYSYSDNYYL